MKIKIVERERQIELQEQEILRRDKELQATIMKPVSWRVIVVWRALNSYFRSAPSLNHVNGRTLLEKDYWTFLGRFQ